MTLVERSGRVMGRMYQSDGEVVFIEPCNNWEHCHVWRQYSAEKIFTEETEVREKQTKMFDAEATARQSLLRSYAQERQEEMAEFSIKFYYTNQVRGKTVTDDFLFCFIVSREY